MSAARSCHRGRRSVPAAGHGRTRLPSSTVTGRAGGESCSDLPRPARARQCQTGSSIPRRARGNCSMPVELRLAQSLPAEGQARHAGGLPVGVGYGGWLRRPAPRRSSRSAPTCITGQYAHARSEPAAAASGTRLNASPTAGRPVQPSAPPVQHDQVATEALLPTTRPRSGKGGVCVRRGDAWLCRPLIRSLCAYSTSGGKADRWALVLVPGPGSGLLVVGWRHEGQDRCFTGPGCGPCGIRRCRRSRRSAGCGFAVAVEMVFGSLVEPFAGMAYALSRTSRLKVGTGVAVLPGRHPVL